MYNAVIKVLFSQYDLTGRYEEPYMTSMFLIVKVFVEFAHKKLC
jgi:hypothetical protein